MPKASSPRTSAQPKARLSLSQVMAELEAAGSEQTRKTYRRHGAPDPMFGVSFATLQTLRKRIGVDHELACALWQSGNYDARNLAMKIVDPQQMAEPELDAWAAGFRTRCSSYVPAIACEAGYGRGCAERWLGADDLNLQCAAWVAIGTLASGDPELADAWFVSLLERIETQIHRVSDDVRYTMNQALIAIGTRNESLRDTALAAAARIGKVVVDPGNTACKTPDASQAIDKAWQHSLAKGYASPAAHERSREALRLRC